MNKEQFQIEESLRIYRWMTDNPDLWEKICGAQGSFDLTTEEMTEIIQTILDAKLYPMLFVFLTNYQHIRPLGRAIQQAYQHQLIEAGQENLAQQLAAEIIGRLQAQGQTPV